jgi:heme-degrading monooxygenase HmoA
VILRVWRARSVGAGVARYLSHFENNVLPELQALSGFHGATLSQRAVEDAVELKVETRWASLDAIRAFAGEDIEAAVVEPEAREVLIDYDERVAHYEIIAEAHGAARPN